MKELPYPADLKGEGLPVMLQKPLQEDLLFIRELWSDPSTMAPVGGARVMDEETSLQWYRRMIEPGSDQDRYSSLEMQKTVKASVKPVSIAGSIPGGWRS